MRVTVNGEAREISSVSVDALLAELDYEGTHFAIALNYDVVPRSRWNTVMRSRSSRQGREGEMRLAQRVFLPRPACGERSKPKASGEGDSPRVPMPVSYTHLTLPTI